MAGDLDIEATIRINAANSDAVLNKFTAGLRELNQQGKITDKTLQDMEKSLGRAGQAQSKSTQATKADHAAWDKQNRIYEDYLKHQEAATKGNEEMTQSLSTTRYALYDVAGSLTTAGTVLAGFAAAIFGAGIAWERDFANVVRTSGIEDPLGKGADAAEHLRDQFVELNQTLPVSASQLAEIGALGGQLGIESDGIQDFTKVVAQLTATTDLSAEAAGTALGRFKALMGVPESEFENLASSILKVGINSVSTESQIANTATQLSSMGTFAGLTADEVVGLSGALASVGTQPELARGTVTRLFTRMSAAVSEGGDRLEEFGRVSGMSGKQFAETWGKEGFGDTLQAFIKGLGKEGGAAVDTLNELGINSVRDIPALLRLADAQEVVNAAFSDAKTGYEDATELADQYQIIQETTAAKLQLLANNFQQFLVALADGGTIFGGLIDGITDVLRVLTDMADHPFWGMVLQFSTIAAGLAGVFLLLAGGAARGAASFIGLMQATSGLSYISLTAAASQGTLAASLNISAASARRLTVAMRIASLAMKTFGIAALAVIVPEVGEWIDTTIEDLSGLDRSFSATAKRLGETDLFGSSFQEQLSGSTNFLSGFVDGLKNIIPGLRSNLEDYADLNEQLKNAAESGDWSVLTSQLEALQQQGFTIGQIREQFPGLTDALKDAGISMGLMADGTIQFTDSEGRIVSATGAAAGGMDAIDQAAQDAANAVNEARRAFEEFNQTAIAQENAQIAYEQALSRVADAASAAGASLFGTNEESLDLRSNAASAADSVWEYTKSLIENGHSADSASDAYDAMRQRLIDTLVARGQDRSEAEKWADKIMGTADEAKGKINEYASSVENIPDSANTDIKNNAPNQSDVVRDYVRNLNSIPKRKSTDIYTNYYSVDRGGSKGGGGAGGGGGGGGGGGMATGGYVRGPGSGTSDDIMTWLSNGEYVIKAASVKKYGLGMLNALNAGRAPKFAAGGLVGGGAGQSVVGSGIMELGPKSLGRLGTGGNVTVVLDDQAIARAANRGNAKLNKFGAR